MVLDEGDLDKENTDNIYGKYNSINPPDTPLKMT